MPAAAKQKDKAMVNKELSTKDKIAVANAANAATERWRPKKQHFPDFKRKKTEADSGAAKIRSSVLPHFPPCTSTEPGKQISVPKIFVSSQSPSRAPSSQPNEDPSHETVKCDIGSVAGNVVKPSVPLQITKQRPSSISYGDEPQSAGVVVLSNMVGTEPPAEATAKTGRPHKPARKQQRGESAEQGSASCSHSDAPSKEYNAFAPPAPTPDTVKGLNLAGRTLSSESSMTNSTVPALKAGEPRVAQKRSRRSADKQSKGSASSRKAKKADRSRVASSPQQGPSSAENIVAVRPAQDSICDPAYRWATLWLTQ